MARSLPFAYQDFAARRLQQASVPLSIDSYRWYQEMLETQPVYFDAERGSWMVFRYDLVQQILLDTHTFSSQREMKEDGSLNSIGSGGILGLDPPRHRQMRSLISQAFSPRTIAQLEPRIISLVESMIDQVLPNGTMDVVDDLAFPLPVMVISELLGIPASEREFFRQIATELLATEYAMRSAAIKKSAIYFTELVAQRRSNPQDDLISLLILARENNEQLSEADILSTCLLLLVAGHETTTNLIASAFLCFDEYPGAMQELMVDPSLLPSAIEEIARYRAPVHNIPRVAMTDTQIAGRDIHVGDFVLPVFAAANFDPAQFPDATRFDIHRSPNRHLGFGHGIHFCIGAPLARLEARIVLRLMLERLSNIRLDHAIPLEIKASSFVYGMKHVQINFD